MIIDNAIGAFIACAVLVALWLVLRFRRQRRVGAQRFDTRARYEEIVRTHVAGPQPASSVEAWVDPLPSPAGYVGTNTVAEPLHQPNKSADPYRQVASCRHGRNDAATLAAEWDEDDLDYIETRAGLQEGLRAALPPLAIFDDETDGSGSGCANDQNTSLSPERSALTQSTGSGPKQACLFDDMAPAGRPASGEIASPNNPLRPPAEPPHRSSDDREDRAAHPDAAQRSPGTVTPASITEEPDAPAPPPSPVDNFRTEPATATLPQLESELDLLSLPEDYPENGLSESFAAEHTLQALDDDEFEDDTDLLDALSDALPVDTADDEPEAPLYAVDIGGDRLGDYDKARRLASETLQRVDADADTLWPVLLDILLESPWPATQRSIERLLNAGTSHQALALAAEIRRVWLDHPEFGQSAPVANSRGESWQYSREALSQLSWPRAARLADRWPTYPDVAEIERFLENLFERWKTDSIASLAFNSFQLYLGYATGDLDGTLQLWPEWSFEMDEALEDSFERMDSPTERACARASLAELGIARPLTHKPVGPGVEIPDC